MAGPAVQDVEACVREKWEEKEEEGGVLGAEEEYGWELGNGEESGLVGVN